MIVDTSAIIAVLAGESDARQFAEAINRGQPKMSAATYLECSIVLDRKGPPEASRRFDAWFRSLGIEIVPVTVEQAIIARAAYRDFGRGSGHRAGLNFGDCFSYALAAESGESLLWKGDDFGHTGIPSALDQPEGFE